MTEPLKPYPDREPRETGGILGAIDACGQLSAFLVDQRGLPMPHQIVTHARIDHHKVVDAADRIRLVELFAEAHGTEVQRGTYAVWTVAPIPTPGPGPELLYQLSAYTARGATEPLP